MKKLLSILMLLSPVALAGEIEFRANKISDVTYTTEQKPEIRLRSGGTNQYPSMRFYLEDGREAGSLTCHSSHSHCSFYVLSNDQTICKSKTAPCQVSIIDIDFGDKPKVNIEVPLVLRGASSAFIFRGEDGRYYQHGVDAAGVFYVKGRKSDGSLGPNIAGLAAGQ